MCVCVLHVVILLLHISMSKKHITNYFKSGKVMYINYILMEQPKYYINNYWKSVSLQRNNIPSNDLRYPFSTPTKKKIK